MSLSALSREISWRYPKPLFWSVSLILLQIFCCVFGHWDVSYIYSWQSLTENSTFNHFKVSLLLLIKECMTLILRFFLICDLPGTLLPFKIFLSSSCLDSDRFLNITNNFIWILILLFFSSWYLFSLSYTYWDNIFDLVSVTFWGTIVSIFSASSFLPFVCFLWLLCKISI